MKGFELINKAMKLEEVKRIPWVPFIGVHAGHLLGLTASEYLKSTEHIIDGVNKAIELYNPDGIPVIFDLQIEAEALGCKLEWADDNPPAVVSHPLMEGTSLKDLNVPCSCMGRIPVVMEATRKLREQHPNIALYGLITGPFTMALHLLGTNIFMQMMMEPDKIHALMRFTTDVAIMMSGNYIESGADIIAIVDPMTSQIDPQSFKTFVSPYVKEINNFIRMSETLSSFFVCGNAKQNIELMCQTNPDNISIDENIPLDFVRDTSLKHNVSFGGNIKLTSVLLLGDEEASQRNALECMDIGGKKGFILAPGCDLGMNTPSNNLRAINKLLYDEVLQGKLRASEAFIENIELLDLTNHWHKEKLIVDIITLDSLSCAPCQYMVNAVSRAAEPYGDKVIFQEYCIKEKKGLQMMASLGVQNLPTIVMDGNIEFISQIPPINDIKAKIDGYLASKN